MYLSMPPHTPLQAPKKYRDHYADWADQQRAIYAAMVSCMDEAIGDIVGALDENDYPASNTLIFFCSDNGGIPRFGSNPRAASRQGDAVRRGRPRSGNHGLERSTRSEQRSR